MRALIVLSILALCVLHHDIWWWDSPGPNSGSSGEGILFGFMPIGLAWHTGISIAASVIWWLATVYCWPTNLDDGSTDRTADQDADQGDAGGSRISGGRITEETA